MKQALKSYISHNILIMSSFKKTARHQALNLSPNLKPASAGFLLSILFIYTLDHVVLDRQPGGTTPIPLVIESGEETRE